jgi:mono/diheme cytochrome c family protein
MKYLRKLALGLGSFVAMTLPAQTNGGNPQAKPPTPPKTAPHQNADPGQRVFEQNCSRCHNAPEGFSDRISGTVAMHMRVRANLSAADYKALLRFLNP